MPSARPTAANRLLAALPSSDRQRILLACQPVKLASGETLAQAGSPIVHVFFPLSGCISQVSAPLDGCRSIEVCLIGDEGMVGISLLLDRSIAPLRAVVQIKGSALRMEARSFLRELQASTSLQTVLKDALCVTLEQLARTVACNHFHRIEARLARWLLMALDRAHSPHFHVTHECLADMLGVRRVGITRAALALQAGGMIDYHRGDITILDRNNLEHSACACYAADKAIYARALGTPRAARRSPIRA